MSEGRWPGPKRHLAPGDILDHVYEGRVTILYTLTLPAGVKAGDRFVVRADVATLVCKDACIPENASVELAIPVVSASGMKAAPEKSADAGRIEESRGAIPIAMASFTPGVQVRWSADGAEILVPGAESVLLYPHIDCSEITDLPHAKSSGGRLKLQLQGGASGESLKLSGVLDVLLKSSGKHTYVELRAQQPVDAQSSPVPGLSPGSEAGQGGKPVRK